MTAEEFRALGLALYGHGWQSALARALDVNIKTVQRWANGAVDLNKNEWLLGKLAELTGSKEAVNAAEFPRDEWIIGDGARKDLDGARAEYIIHTKFPRFIARIVDESGDAPEQAADTLTGVVYALDENTVLCEFVWHDRPPAPAEMTRLMESACDAIAGVV